MAGVKDSLSTIQENSTPGQSSDKVTLPKNRQKRLAIQARIKYREQTIKTFQRHLKQGTFPKRMKSIKPYPKMCSPECQAIVKRSSMLLVIKYNV